MLERAIARYNLDPAQSWMVGDSHRDLEAAGKVGVRSVIIGDKYKAGSYTWQVQDLWEAAQIILREKGKQASWFICNFLYLT